jgi:putative intracellular protease/amidase
MVLSDTTNTSSTNTAKHKPLNYIIALFPGFQLLDLTGPLDILNIISYNQPITLTFLASTLDPVSTKPTPPKSANYTYDLKALNGTGEIGATFNQSLTPDSTFTQYLDDLNSNKIPASARPDILFIPGGLGSRLLRITPTADGDVSSLNIEDLISWIPKVTPHLRTGIMTVCTGSDILARTGLLNSRRATTNMLRFNDVAGRNPSVEWVKGARWAKSPRGEGEENVGRDKEMWTSAGISAGMDLTLALVAEYYGGLEVSRDLAMRLEYDWAEPEEGEVCKFYGKYFDV